jgi:8-oxo-dGTP pyrophosphatase MutT (NUDIX family)
MVRAGGRWTLPKGLVEPGESPAQAALREVAEECGLPPAGLVLGEALPGSDYVYRREGRLVFKHVDLFLVTAPAGARLTPQVEEVEAAEWMDLDEATRRAGFADVRAALGRARQLLG